MANFLLLDASTKACTVAILINDLCFSRQKVGKRLHNKHLLHFIDDLCQEAGIGLADLDAVAVGVGPGSFVGVRLAASVAQAVAFANDLPVIALSSLALLAQTAYGIDQITHALVLVDAHQGQVYAGHYALDQGVMQPKTPDQIVLPSDIKLQQGAMAVGEGWQIYSESLPQLTLNERLLALLPDVSMAKALVEHAWVTKCYVNPQSVAPVYLRGANRWSG